MTPAPPPPPPPPSNAANIPSRNSYSKPAGIPNTSALLKSIEKGTKLKKTVTNDRSAPLVSNQSNSSVPNRAAHNQGPSSSICSVNSTALGGLFANGFPTLRSTSNKSNADQNISKSTHENMPTLLKKPIKTAAENITERISRNPEKAYDITQKGAKIIAPALVSEAKKQDMKSNISAEISNNIKNVERNIGKISISTPTKVINSEQKSKGRWNFAAEVEENIPSPRKFTGCKKKYLSEINDVRAKKPQSEARISEEDVVTFIKTLKSKLSKAASDENFEECVRLKKKLHSFESIEKRIKSGEQLFTSDLPK